VTLKIAVVVLWCALSAGAMWAFMMGIR